MSRAHLREKRKLIMDSVTVTVTAELLEALGGWSRPVQVRIDPVPYGTGYEMTARWPEPERSQDNITPALIAGE
jgi:hypothetical protein